MGFNGCLLVSLAFFIGSFVVITGLMVIKSDLINSDL